MSRNPISGSGFIPCIDPALEVADPGKSDGFQEFERAAGSSAGFAVEDDVHVRWQFTMAILQFGKRDQD